MENDAWDNNVKSYCCSYSKQFNLAWFKQKTEEKQIVSKQLSQDEQLLQNDMDWLSQINDKLHLIERG